MANDDIITITEQNFEDEVLKSNLPVLIDFWAEWCGPCKMLTPILEELAPEYKGKVVIGKCDVDSNAPIAARYGIISIPTMLFVKNGDIIEQQTGILTKNALKTKIDRVFEL